MINVLSLFSGIGAFEKALKNIGVEFRIVNYCEIDKYASKVYSMLHNVSEELNLNDVTEIDTSKLHDIDLITYGFPCQDISIAGKQRGFTDNKGNRTRSGLFFEALRIIEDTKPKYAIAENVKALTSKKFETEFGIVLDSLEHAGYNNYWQVLNAKDYGVPQNRERIFIVSIRKDIDNHEFTFPDKLPLTKTLKDMLEPKVDEKYYINNERAKNLIEQIKSRYIITDSLPVDGTLLEPKAKEVCNCIAARYDAGIQNQKSIGCMVVEPNSQIRKLTPKECFRLMGFSDADFSRVHGISNSQLYKQAGNSIVVNVLECIFKQLFFKE